MEAVINFIYSNILSILMMVLMIAVGVFLTIKTKVLQFRRFGYALKNTVGSLFDKSQHFFKIFSFREKKCEICFVFLKKILKF